MKFTLTTFLTLLVFTSFGQRIKYLDTYFSEVDNKKEATYYTETTLKTSNQGFVKTFFLNGILYSEAEYSDLYHKKQGGLTRTFYDNGNIKAEYIFKDGLLDGPVKTFYKNRRLKRAELYVKGKIEQSKCFSKAGYDTTYYPLQTGAMFPGGLPALNKFIQANIKKATYTDITVEHDVLLHLTVTPEGKVETQKVIYTSALHYEEEAKRLIQKMPAWIPATHDGEPIHGIFYLPINYSR